MEQLHKYKTYYQETQWIYLDDKAANIYAHKEVWIPSHIFDHRNVVPAMGPMVDSLLFHSNSNTYWEFQTVCIQTYILDYKKGKRKGKRKALFFIISVSQDCYQAAN